MKRLPGNHVEICCSQEDFFSQINVIMSELLMLNVYLRDNSCRCPLPHPKYSMPFFIKMVNITGKVTLEILYS